MAVIADVFEVVLIDDDGGVAATGDLQDGNIEISVEESDGRAGRGNQLYGILHSDRDINITLNDVIFKFDWLAKQFGQDIVTGEGEAYAMPQWYQIDTEVVDGTVTSASIELNETPIEGSVKAYGVDGELIEVTGVTGNVVSIPVVEGQTEVEVRTYKYATAADTQSFEIDNSVFAKGVKAIMETIELDESTEQATHRIQYEFHKALPTGNFSIETASAREPQAQEFSLRVIKPKTSTKVGIVKRIPINVA